MVGLMAWHGRATPGQPHGKQVLLLLLALGSMLTAPTAQAEQLEPPDLPAEASSTCPRQWPTRIGELEVTGLWRTELFIVQNELPWRPGELVTEAAWKLGLARLWNLGLFSRVDGQLHCDGGDVRAQLSLEERWTLNPLFSFQVLVRGDEWAVVRPRPTYDEMLAREPLADWL